MLFLSRAEPMTTGFQRRMQLSLVLASALLLSVWEPSARAQENATDAPIWQIRLFYDALLDTMKQAGRLGI